MLINQSAEALWRQHAMLLRHYYIVQLTMTCRVRCCSALVAGGRCGQEVWPHTGNGCAQWLPYLAFMLL